MLVTWPPGRGQTISLPPPGIEPGSPASQSGTLPKELSRHLILWVSYTPLTRNNTQQHIRTPNNRQLHTTTVHNSTRVHKITNVPLFKKLWDLIFFLWDNNFMSHFKGHFEGPRLFWPLNCPSLRSGQFKGSKKSWPPQNVPWNGS